MRLVDLKPRWLAEPGRRGQGMTFICPHCAGQPSPGRLAVVFANPLDGGEPLSLQPAKLFRILWPPAGIPEDVTTVPPGTHWTRSGDSFENITLHPSVDASASGHWHGFVRDGNTA